jgi:hypothetical protein
MKIFLGNKRKFLKLLLKNYDHRGIKYAHNIIKASFFTLYIAGNN